MENRAEQPYRLALRSFIRTQRRECIRLREQEKIGILYVKEASYCGGIESDALLKSPPELACSYGYILQLSEDIAEREAYESDIIRF